VTSESVWRVARRVLGVYFVVEGLLYAAGAAAMLGIVVPEGSSRAGYVSASLLQGVIGVVAGVILLRGNSRPSDSAPIDVDPVALKRGALQLLGMFFLVQGAITFARAAGGAITVEAGWQFRTSEFTAAAVELVSAGLLIMRPGNIARALQKYEGA